MIHAPELKYFATLKVEIDAPQEVGVSVHGERRIIPITGGTVQGNGWQGKVLRGGADYQLILTPRLTHLDAQYAIELDNGELIYIHNKAIRVASAEITQKIKIGEPVAPELIYFRCHPVFETSSPSMQWITERVFVGTGIRRPNLVELQIFEVL
ncbi:DUF3237 domain-containing protein [Marinomonas polaris]|jgi:hypothetical protein|uniref:DUF3237 domain-containing protein n=1 Tax=Marinomonas TaxID=28253 RepID=UPI000C1DFDEE|nr:MULTISPECIES: DUF3237 domain-containing protein [unclassified Marinomonas]PJE55435.1 hypothetical protein TY87_09900 [Marinomonas sp. BSi20584]